MNSIPREPISVLTKVREIPVLCSLARTVFIDKKRSVRVHRLLKSFCDIKILSATNTSSFL